MEKFWNVFFPAWKIRNMTKKWPIFNLIYTNLLIMKKEGLRVFK